MIISVGEVANKRAGVNIGTHNGIFHCDDVVAITIIEIVGREEDIHVVRSRNIDELKKLRVVVDIGGGIFDHHMAGFNECRATGEKYASAGLVWKQYGGDAIASIAIEHKACINFDEVRQIKEQIDREIIVPIDLEDNGEADTKHMFSFINKFLPTWLEKPDYDEAFSKVQAIVFDILYNIIKDKVVQVAAKNELQKRCRSVVDGILEIPAQTMPWLEEVVKYNESHNHEIKFVIFRYPGKGWAAQCVPPSVEEKFSQLVPFPKAWAGGNEETLPKLSGIEDATFCHNGCFFVRARTKQSIIEMCKIAMK